MSMHFIKAGLQTSLQDLGRPGLMHLGISKSGAMDSNAMKSANWLVDKPLDSAVIEVALIGPKIRFEQPMSIAVSGASFELYLNGYLVFNDETIQVKMDDILEFDRLQQGVRAYIAFSGELQSKPILGSYSTHLTAKFGSFNNRQFNDNDHLKISSTPPSPHKKMLAKNDVIYSGKYLLRCTRSVESDQFSQEQTEQFYAQRFQVTPECNRMGIKLSGKSLEFEKTLEMTSCGLTQGSIQVPPNGQPIISSVDGQTIGGYPRIANIISADLPLLGQLKAGDQLNFTLVTQSNAEKMLAEVEVFRKSLTS